MAKNEKGSISGCQNCKDERRWCTVLQENPAIRQSQTILHPSGSWDHLAVKLKAKIKLPKVVPYNTNNEAQGSPLVLAVGKGEGEGEGEDASDTGTAMSNRRQVFGIRSKDAKWKDRIH